MSPMLYLVQFLVPCKIVSGQSPIEITPPERCIPWPVKATVPKILYFNLIEANAHQWKWKKKAQRNDASSPKLHSRDWGRINTRLQDL